ncbi:hypothetical protein EJ07DRAFT_99864, partial [Lizonia empirigonia]
KLSEVVHNLQAQYQLQQDELLGLKQALTTKKKRNKPNRILELEKPQEDEGESQIFTPSKFDHARDLHTAKEQQKRDKEAEKVMNQQLRDANKAYKLKIHQEKLEARRVAKVEREQRKAEEVAGRQRKKETQEANRNAQKALQLPQTGKRKASSTQKPVKKRVVEGLGGAESVDAPDAPSPPPPITTRRGRSVTLPMKYR